MNSLFKQLQKMWIILELGICQLIADIIAIQHIWKIKRQTCIWYNNNKKVANVAVASISLKNSFTWRVFGACAVRTYRVNPSEDFKSMMASSNGNIFRVTGHLCGEITGHRWIPRTKASDAELWCFLWSAPESTVEAGEAGEAGDLKRHRHPIMTSL